METKHLIILLFTCTLLNACTCGSDKADTGNIAKPVPVFASLSNDSILIIAERAYLHDDPHALYMMWLAAWERHNGTLPDSITTVSLDEAEIMLLHAASLHYEPALDAIRTLSAHGMWAHSIPEDK